MTKKFKPDEVENNILEYWKNNKIFQKAREKNKNNKDFYFLDGPPYTSGKVHIGTAWNKVLKDCVLRFKRSRGFNVWDRAGYDMHGLPIEHKVQEKLKLEQKEDIQKYGVKDFMKECKNLAVENLEIMNDDFRRMGVWMDFDNAYQSISPDYIEGIWWLIKKAYEKGRLYEDYRPIHWDYVHQSALAKHELEYETVKDKSIFLKFKVKGKENEYLIVWTTTPWTIAYNLGVMVNPELDYIKADVGGEKWIVAKGLAGPVIKMVADKDFETTEEFKGEELEGLEYEHPFHKDLGKHYDSLKEKHQNVHSVLLSKEYVTLDAGTGLVHTAPGCGPEDFEIGHKYSIPAWNNLMENGKFPEDMGKLSGLHARKDNDKFIELMKDQGTLIESTEVEHDYPFGQRSHEPVVFRATKQWFFKVEDLKDKMIKENNEIKWVPEAAYNAFNSWLENLRDNSISKQRYWGTPLPIWRADDGDIIVIGSRKEYEDLTGKKLEDLHIPWVDETPIEKDGKTYKRIPDVLDVWVDAGTASWNCLNFPADQETFRKMFPADFILEGKDQIRGWFNLLMVASMLGMEEKPFENVYMHGFVQDAEGRKMSKSLGNVISPYEVIEKFSADTLRYFMIGGTNPGLDINYNFNEVKVKHKNLGILWNLHNYLIDLSRTNKINPKDVEINNPGVEERYIISKLNSSIKRCTECFEDYRINEAPWRVEELFLELSRGYIQKVRERSNDRTVIGTIYRVLMETLKMFSPVAPFMTEQIYLNMKEEFGLEKESISLYDWPSYDEEKIDENLEEEFRISDEVTQALLYAREKAQLGVRWPVREVMIESASETYRNAVEKRKELIKKQVNARDVKIVEDAGFEKKAKPNYKKIREDFENLVPQIMARLATESRIIEKLNEEDAVKLKVDGQDISLDRSHFTIHQNTPDKYSEGEINKGMVYINKEMDKDLESEGYTREVMRRVQIVRKEMGLNKTDRIQLSIESSEKLKAYLQENEELLKEKVGADELHFGEGEKEFNIKGEKVKIKCQQVHDGA
ncbi:MAG: isoleucine--tRNA ligase [Nanobdellota archaeon]